MPRRTEEELQKHTLFLFKGDFEKLGSYYPEVSTALVVRKILRAHLNKLDRKLKELEDGEASMAELEV